MRILVLRGGAVGDFIVTMPALALLRRRWPGARIELVGNARAAELGVQAGLLDAVHSQHEARWAALYGEGGASRYVASTAIRESGVGANASEGNNTRRGEFTGWLASFDVVVSFWPDPERELARYFEKLGETTGQRFIAAGAHVTTTPAARHFCDALAPLGLATVDFNYRLPRLTIESARTSEVTGKLGARRMAPTPSRVVAMHPGSGSTRKNWPVERWRELALKSELPVLWITGPAEEERDMSPPAAAHIVWSREESLTQLADELGRCALFVGHDSGLAHLAAAVGTRCVLLFGPTDPAMWAPPGNHVRVVRRGEDLHAITLDEVSTAIAECLAEAGVRGAGGTS